MLNSNYQFIPCKSTGGKKKIGQMLKNVARKNIKMVYIFMYIWYIFLKYIP